LVKGELREDEKNICYLKRWSLIKAPEKREILSKVTKMKQFVEGVKTSDQGILLFSSDMMLKGR
jgi:hypothetical protein